MKNISSVYLHQTIGFFSKDSNNFSTRSAKICLLSLVSKTYGDLPHAVCYGKEWSLKVWFWKMFFLKFKVFGEFP